jgi:2-oxoglutarate ferredoxin oxidoreductase subunit delta
MDLFVVKAAKPEACIACMQCELRCPDFAIKVHKLEDK